MTKLKVDGRKKTKESPIEEKVPVFDINNETEEEEQPSVIRTIFSPVLKVGKILSGKDSTDGSDHEEVGSSSSSNEEEEEDIRLILEEEEKHEKSSDSEEESEAEEYEEFDSFMFIAALPKELPYPSARNLLPELSCSEKKTLVLDLDETLVHCSLEKIDNPDLVFSVPFSSMEYKVR